MSLRCADRLRILYVGAERHGSNSAGLARALRSIGHVVSVIDPERFFPCLTNGFSAKLVNRVGAKLAVKSLGNEILNQAALLKPDFALVFKGEIVDPAVLLNLRCQGVYSINFFPDVSIWCHGPLLPKTLPLYDRVFTTKSFGVNDLQTQLGIECVDFVPHGFDPDVHREVKADVSEASLFGADASFIGTWSPKKEELLSILAEYRGECRLRVWGNQWEHCRSQTLRKNLMYRAVTGDLYALAIGCSRINIAILSELRRGASSGDRITSRTFHIPASGGFMLHERSCELLQFFEEDREVVCFSTGAELVDKVEYYLANEDERERIRLNGWVKCRQEHSWLTRARVIVSRFRDAE